VAAKFSAGEVDFHRAEFSGGKVSFDHATFSDGNTVSFSSAKFSGGQVDFGAADDWSHPPTFDWHGKTPAGVVLPAGADVTP